MLDLEKLLEDISEQNPCGDDLEYDPDFQALERNCQGKAEQKIGDSVISAKEPKWKEVQNKALHLFSRTKDLRVAFILTKSLIHNNGFSGLSEGLSLKQKLLEKYWSTLYPLLDKEDNDDPTMRLNVLTSLSDYDTILRPLREHPLVTSRSLGKFSLRDIDAALGKITPTNNSNSPVPDITTIEAAFMDGGKENLEKTYSSIKSSLSCLEAIQKYTTEKVGIESAPDLSKLKELLMEANQLVKEKLGNQEDTPISQTDTEANSQTSQSTAPAAKQFSTGTISSRDDVIRTLDKVCDYYKMHEPSSPVPMLLERAKRLVSKNFMDILNDLVPTGVKEAENFQGPKKK